jgi:copper chaperone NosL
MLLTVLVAAACQQGKPGPVDIVWNEDSCIECRMAVSDHKFGCEVVSADGTAQAFDDIGCLVLWARKNGLPAGGAAYVLDFNTGGWIDAETAVYLLAPSMPTPMSYGIGAFKTKADAELAAKQWPGQTLSWTELSEAFKP